ncbi:MAG: dihydrolipoamide acetyltransferase family protein, partial [Solirubrobacteraceae bacterium]
MSAVAMPRLSDSMEEGTILRWLAADGEAVRRGQELAEIETDKASMVYEADAAGTLRILAREGETLPVGAPIAELLAEGELAGGPAAEAGAAVGAAANGVGAESQTTVGSAQLTEERVPVQAAPLPAVEAAAALQTRVPASAGQVVDGGERVKASPLARRLAAEAGIELAALAGSGPGGRVVKADVERARDGAPPAVANGASVGAPSGMQTQTSAAAASATPAASGAPETVSAGAKGAAEVVELTRTQEMIARRMAEAKATIPEFTLSCEIEMDAAVELRGALKALAESRGVAAPSYNDLVVRACALALREHPRANGSYRDGRFELHERVNVGVAVAAKDTLVVPVLRDVDSLSVFEIAAEARRLALAVRDGKVTPPELSGGTFSVSNLGMFGVDTFIAVINPPQAAILA